MTHEQRLYKQALRLCTKAMEDLSKKGTVGASYSVNARIKAAVHVYGGIISRKSPFLVLQLERELAAMFDDYGRV